MANSLPTVFISYNPASTVEQTLAIRLHTIGAVHGFNMLLPDRTFTAQSVSNETRNRILLSDFFILFSTAPMSNVVQEEISIAYSKLHDRSKILVVYDQTVGKNLKSTENHTEVFIDTREDALKIVTDITKTIQSVQSKKAQGDSFLSSLGGILLIGVGLFALNEMFSDDEPDAPRKRNTSTKKRKPVKRKRSY
jgi:hypothetical protein